MLDTVRLFTPEYLLKPVNRFIHRQEVSEETGEVVSDSRYFNGEHFSADLRGSVLSVSTSLPKLLYKTSLREVGDSDFAPAVSAIEGRLRKAGVSVAQNNLADFSLSRVDFCANLQVDHAPMDYLLCLTDFSMSRRDKRDISHETVSFRNSDRELTMYNKVREVRETEKDRQVLQLVSELPENILRVESRLKRQRAILRTLRRTHATLENVFDFHLSRSHLLHEVESLVQNSEESQGEFDFHENLQLLDHVMSARKRGGFKEFLAVKGVRSFLSEFRFDWGKVREFLLCRYSPRRTYEILRDLRGYHKLLLEKEDRDLLGEIKSKLRLVA